MTNQTEPRSTSNCTVPYIPLKVDTLRDWLEQLQKIAEPKVCYCEDKEAMMETVISNNKIAANRLYNAIVNVVNGVDSP